MSVENESIETIERRMRDHAVQAVLDTLVWHTAASLGEMEAEVAALRDNGEIFSIRHDGVELYPGFAFSTASFPKPLPVIGKAISLFVEARGQPGGWQMAFWFASHNGFLAGLRPADIAATNPQLLLAALRSEPAGILHG